MIITIQYKKSRDQKYREQLEREATQVYKLWYPRPKTTEKIRGNPLFERRISALIDYGYELSELRDWFRLGGGRAKTNTVAANLVWDDIKACYNYRCAYCGKPTKRLTKDHIYPISRGGADSMDNVVPACFKCNREKQAKELMDWGKFKKLPLHLLGFPQRGNNANT